MISLVIGASGQVGALLFHLSRDEQRCVGTYHRNPMPGLCQLDVRDLKAVRQLIQKVRPDVCYLPGALTYVDYAENHPHECHKINVVGTDYLARAMAEVEGVLVFFSTDHVFGDSPRSWKEEDPVSPRSVYAKSKVEAERIIRQILPDQHLILRTSWVFGPDPQEKNFFWRVCRTLEKGEELIVPSDQHGQPTYGPDLARTARQLVERGDRGTFHVVGPESLSRLAWARLIAKMQHLPTDLIQGQPTSSIPFAAHRPTDIRLERSKLLTLIGYDPIRSPQRALQEMQSGITPAAEPA